MKHIQTTHRFSYKGRIWEMTINDEDFAKLKTRKSPFTWDFEWGFVRTQKTPAYAMQMIRHCWLEIKDKPDEKFSDERPRKTS